MYNYSDETKGLLALSYAEGTNEEKNEMLRSISPKDIFKLTFETEKFNKNLIDSLKITIENLDYLLNDLKEKQIMLLSIYDNEYPFSLKNIDNPPKLLYLKGNVALLKQRMIAVVGTRKPTHYGIKVTEDFVKQFALNNLVVVSGMARGLDTVAHKACVALDKPTIAVFGCGLDVCYPAENKALRDDIIRYGGLIVSEYKPDIRPLQFHFPERNRIICGLSEGVFLAEAAKSSGSIISARLAVEQGKELFIVPGNISSEASLGSNALLKEMQGAMVLSPSDVLSALNINPQKEEKPSKVQLSFVASKVVEILYSGEMHFEEILSNLDVSSGELSGVLLELEILGLIVKLPSNYYTLA